MKDLVLIPTDLIDLPADMEVPRLSAKEKKAYRVALKKPLI